jgi:hypothetical protein
MSTGYTHNVMDGKITEFSEFALQCARAFRALITMRDDPQNATIPDEFKPEPYYQEKLAGAKEHMLTLQTMLPEQREIDCKKDYEEQVASKAKYKARAVLENERLEAMEKQVLAWVPPSAKHIEMKNFMLDQIEISKNDLSYYDRYDKIEKKTSKEWYYEQFEKAQKDIGYYAAEWEKEVERAKSRTLWVKQLRESLNATS